MARFVYINHNSEGFACFMQKFQEDGQAFEKVNGKDVIAPFPIWSAAVLKEQLQRAGWLTDDRFIRLVAWL